MIQGFVRGITSDKFLTLAQNTDACVKIETGLKAVGRPAFTLIDKNTDKETRKYAASKEFLYQALCLGIYMMIIPPVFKNGGFKLAQKIFKSENLPNFKNAKEVLAYHRLANMKPAERLLEQNKKYLDLVSDTLINPKDGRKLRDYLIVDKTPRGALVKQGKMFELAKGSIELFSIIGSVVGLTILAPELSHLILHPVMKFCGLEDKHHKTEKTVQQTLDKKV